MNAREPDARCFKAGRALDFKIHDSFSSVTVLWDRLELSNGTYPFQRRAWLETWYDTIGKTHGWRLAIIEMKKDGAHALFPLGVRKAGGLKRLEWLGWGVSDYANPLFDNPGIFSTDGVIRTLRVAAAHESCDLVHLDRIPETLADGSENPFARGRPMARQHFGAHAMTLSGQQSRSSTLSAKERYNIRRSEKLLAAGGRLEFSVAIDQAERSRVTEEMIRQKRERYAQMAVVDNYADPSMADFYRKATNDPKLGVHVSTLYLDGEPLSLHWGISDWPRMYYLMPSFKLDTRTKYSPGTIFLTRFLDMLHSEKYTLLDFADGDEAYKDKWCDIHMSLYRARLGVSLKGKTAATFENLLDAIRKSPFKPALLKIRDRIRKTRARM
jgi:CelD/BcsL family acetyltransferase involved in cellulose biosynthesis